MNLNIIKSKKILLAIDIVVVLVMILLPLVSGFLLSGEIRECSLQALVGLLCPACGGTRCVYNFFNGRFVTAFNYNAYIFFSIIYVLVCVLVLNIKILLKSKAAEKVFAVLSDYRFIIAWAIGFIVFGVLRNII